MKCVILAAGYATRLYPLTENFPKPLLEVGGRTILDWLIEDLSPVTEEFIVVTNHRFAPVFQEWRHGRIHILDDGTVSNETRLGAVRDIRLAAEGIDEPVLVTAGDNLLDFSLIPFLEFSRNAGTSCVMCHEESDIQALRRTAVITVDEEGKITSYEEKPKEPKGHLAVPPFYYYLPADLRRIEEALRDGCCADAPGSFAAWLSRRTEMHAWKMNGHRIDIGNIESLEKARSTYEGII